jgi:iron(III) transport system substrate-binding protein
MGMVLILSSLTNCFSAFAAEPLLIYSKSEEREHKLWEAFFKENGLDVRFLHLSSGIIWSRVMAEAKAGKVRADLNMSNMDFTHAVMKKGLVLPHKSKTWRASNIPQQYWDPDGSWYGWSFVTTVVIVNTDLLKKGGKAAPKTWHDLLDPKWKGEIVMPNPGTSGRAYCFMSTMLQMLGEEKGWAYAEKLHKNVAQYTKSGSAPADLVARGEFTVGITWDLPPQEKKKAGYPVELVLPQEGTGYTLDTVFIFKDTDKAQAAKKFVDLCGTKRFMEIAGMVRSKVTMPGVKSRFLTSPKVIDYDAAWAADNKKKIMSTWKEKFAK